MWPGFAWCLSIPAQRELYLSVKPLRLIEPLGGAPENTTRLRCPLTPMSLRHGTANTSTFPASTKDGSPDYSEGRPPDMAIEDDSTKKVGMYVSMTGDGMRDKYCAVSKRSHLLPMRYKSIASRRVKLVADAVACFLATAATTPTSSPRCMKVTIVSASARCARIQPSVRPVLCYPYPRCCRLRVSPE